VYVGVPKNQQAVVAIPDIYVHKRSRSGPLSSSSLSSPSVDNDLYIVLGCDGVWDVLSDDEVAHELHTFLMNRPPHQPDQLARACDHLLSVCMDKQTDDNLSVIAISLSSPEQFVTLPPPPSASPSRHGSSSSVDSADNTSDAYVDAVVGSFASDLAASARKLFIE
jgi:serine/threonine protein phosphatase PrpC